MFDAGHGVNPNANPETRAAFPIRFMLEANTSLSVEAVLPTLREAYDKLHKKYKKRKVFIISFPLELLSDFVAFCSHDHPVGCCKIVCYFRCDLTLSGFAPSNAAP